jgi:exosortase
MACLSKMNLEAEITDDRAEQPPFEWAQVLRSPAFVPALVVLVALGVCFWPLFRILPSTWLSKDGYYSHGFLVPLISGYVVYRWWPKLRTIPVRGSMWAAPFLLATLFVTWAGGVADLRLVLSICLVAILFFGVWFVAGGRWALALALPCLYLLFAMPIWTFAIDFYTAPLQRLSTQVSFEMLRMAGFGPVMTDSTTIVLGNYQFEVAVACSGFKLLIAVTAFTAFFMMIGNLRWWGNLAMTAIILPLCLLINGLRVALIGVVGDSKGEAAALQFHDWSGYITLLICFFLLFKFARWLGWKD